MNERVEDLFLQIKDIIDRFSEYHDSLDKSLEKYSSSKNTGQYKSEFNNTFRSITTLKEELKKAIEQMEVLEPEIGKKMREVEKKQAQKIDDQKALLDLGVSLADKRISKESYESRKAEKERSFTAATEEIQEIFDELGSM